MSVTRVGSQRNERIDDFYNLAEGIEKYVNKITTAVIQALPVFSNNNWQAGKIGLPSSFIIFNFQIMNNTFTGTVKFFDESKGFGFIRHDESNKETFVHVNGLIHEIQADDRVEFELQEGRKGMNAVNVKRID